METLQIAYKILYELEHNKTDTYKGLLISPEKLNVDSDKWLEVVQSLVDEQYITGVRVSRNIMGETMVDIKNARITLKGAEYLQENSVMKKIGKVATDVITIAKDVAKLMPKGN